MLEWGPCPREAGPTGPRLSSPGERERNTVMANRLGVNMLQFCSVSNSLSHTTLSIKWEVYFSKELYHSSLLCHRYDSACICICSMWLYNIYIYIYIYIYMRTCLYIYLINESRLKCLYTDQDILVECNFIRCIFEYSPSWD